jgi:hypothetical protein
MVNSYLASHCDNVPDNRLSNVGIIFSMQGLEIEIGLVLYE